MRFVSNELIPQHKILMQDRTADVTISRKLYRAERLGVRVLFFRRSASSALLRRFVTTAARSGERSGREKLRMKMYLV